MALSTRIGLGVAIDGVDVDVDVDVGFRTTATTRKRKAKSDKIIRATVIQVRHDDEEGVDGDVGCDVGVAMLSARGVGGAT